MSADGWCMAQAKRKGSKSGDDSKPSTSATGASGDDSSDVEVDEEVLNEGTSASSSDDEDGGLVPEAEPGKASPSLCLFRARPHAFAAMTAATPAFHGDPHGCHACCMYTI